MANMVRFIKELVSRPLRSSKGWPIQFEPVGDDMGILETNDPFTIGELRKCIAASRGGVREVTSDEEWEDAKKKASEREQWRQRVKSPWSDPVRIERGTKRQPASPATGSAPPPDPSIKSPPPIGKAIEVPAKIEPAPKTARKPKAAKGTKAVEAAEPPVQTGGT